jgi:hypothetical protein
MIVLVNPEYTDIVAQIYTLSIALLLVYEIYISPKTVGALPLFNEKD